MELAEKVRIEKIKVSGIRSQMQDIVPREVLLEIILNKRHISTLSCTPGNIRELVTGYLISGGYLEKYPDINIIDICSSNKKVEKHQNPVRKVKVRAVERAGAGMNKRGPGDPKENYAAENSPDRSPACNQIPVYSSYISTARDRRDRLILKKEIRTINSTIKIDTAVVTGLNKKTVSYQKQKSKFGGLHCSALFDTDGKMLSIMEDIGRYNCLDKIFGYMLTEEIAPQDKIIYTSGRISLDIIIKASNIQVPVIVSNSSVTSSAAKLAEKIDLTLIGYARGNRFNIYSSPDRIINKKARKARF